MKLMKAKDSTKTVALNRTLLESMTKLKNVKPKLNDRALWFELTFREDCWIGCRPKSR